MEDKLIKQYNYEQEKKKNKFDDSYDKAKIKKMEEELGIKFLDFLEGIILYQGIKWRPLKNNAEYLCAAFDGIQILRIYNFVFVPTTWTSE